MSLPRQSSTIWLAYGLLGFALTLTGVLIGHEGYLAGGVVLLGAAGAAGVRRAV